MANQNQQQSQPQQNRVPLERAITIVFENHETVGLIGKECCSTRNNRILDRFCHQTNEYGIIPTSLKHSKLEFECFKLILIIFGFKTISYGTVDKSMPLVSMKGESFFSSFWISRMLQMLLCGYSTPLDKYSLILRKRLLDPTINELFH
ncbi:hypothetical protein ACTFIY_009460 [Dictyostelium cf. discoideum]